MTKESQNAAIAEHNRIRQSLSDGNVPGWPKPNKPLKPLVRLITKI